MVLLNETTRINMNLEEAIEYFGSASLLCKELNIAPQNATAWKKNNTIPIKQQLRIQQITKDELKANMELIDKVHPRKIIEKNHEIMRELQELREFKAAHQKGINANEQTK